MEEIIIKIGGKEYTKEEARELYYELKSLFDPDVTTIFPGTTAPSYYSESYR